MVVWVMTGILVHQAMRRLIKPEPVDGIVMFWVSFVGIIMNLVLMRVLAHDEEDGAHGFSHGHSHNHGHSHAHAPPPIASAYRPPARPASENASEQEASRSSHRGPHPNGEHEDGRGDVDSKSLAVRAAMAHVIGDILQSVGVCVAAALIWAFHDSWLDERGVSYWYRAVSSWRRHRIRADSCVRARRDARMLLSRSLPYCAPCVLAWCVSLPLQDPICTIIFSVLVMWSTMGTMREAMHVLMEGVPSGVDTADLLLRLKAIPSVLGVHDLHAWTLAGDKSKLWAKITVESGADHTSVLYAAERVARAVNCHHTCFQLEDVSTYDRRFEGRDCFEPPDLPA